MNQLVLSTILFLLTTGLQAQSKLFEEVTSQAGIFSAGGNKAVAIMDFDGDRFVDIFVSRKGQPNLLFRNRGDGAFAEVATQNNLAVVGNSGMALWGDINNDGFLDLYMAGIDEPNLLFINQAGVFTDQTDQAGVGDVLKTEATGFIDYDNDGLLDIFIFNRAGENAFYHARDGLTFTNVIVSTGVWGRANAMGLAIVDYDNDGDQDIYLVYDGRQANNLYRNNGDGTFTDVADQAGLAVQAEGMAPAFADFNNDGYLDLYITNMFENLLFENNRNGTFTDVTQSAGVADIGMGWGVTWLDYNNDGWLDLYIVNASSFNSPPDPNVLYHNNHDGTFTVVNAGDPSSSLLSGFAAACGDVDRDGYIDLFVTNEGRSNQLFRNLGSGNNWLKIRLRGTQSNRDALGARVILRAGHLEQTREVSGGMGWFSQNSPVVHFGLAQVSSVDELEIHWPSGLVERFGDGVTLNQEILIEEGVGTVTSVAGGTLQGPRDFSLGRGYPNPFSRTESTGNISLPLTLGGNAAVAFQVAVFNIVGQRVRTLAREVRQPGSYSLQWDGRSDSGKRLGNGVYVIQIVSGNLRQSRKVLLLP